MSPVRLFLLSAFLAAGCQRPEIAVYTAPKDVLPPPEPPTQNIRNPQAEVQDRIPAPVSNETPAHPKISYEIPAGWSLGPVGQVSTANFIVKGDSGEATVNITPLANFAGREEALVNMWRNQVGAPQLSAEEAGAALTPLEIAGSQGLLFEVNGSRDGKNNRIVTAMLHRPDGTWFFKLAGEDTLVSAQKSVFLDFLKSVHFDTAPESVNPVSPPDTKDAPPPPATGN